MHIFRNFKSFKDAKLELFEPVTLLIGKNGSGKTNAIEGVDLLANLAHGRPLYEIADVGRGAGIFEVRGGLAGCCRLGGNEFELAFEGSTEAFGGDQDFTYKISVQVASEPSVFEESFEVGERHIFSASRDRYSKSPLLRVVYDNFSRGGNKPSTSLAGDRSVLSRYRVFTADLESKGDNYKEASRVASLIQRYLRASFVFDPNPKSMRAYERIGQKVLTRDGGNLSAVLYSLKDGSDEEKRSLGRILAWIKQLPEEPYLQFEFVTTSQNDVLFGLKEKEDGQLMDARVLSDGTLRSLAVLTALETVEKESRIVIEEFDNGVHPSRVGVLANAIWDCSHRRKLNVLVTTHNPATLDVLEEKQLSSVVLCFFDTQQRAARMIPLLSIPKSDVLLERGHLGDLVTRRVLEQHLLPNFEEKQRTLAKEWLSSIK